MEQLPYGYQPDGVAHSGAVLQNDAIEARQRSMNGDAFSNGEPYEGERIANEPPYWEPYGNGPVAGEFTSDEPVVSESIEDEPVANDDRVSGEPIVGTPASNATSGSGPAGNEPAAPAAEGKDASSRNARHKLKQIRSFCIRVLVLVAFIYILFFWVVGVGVVSTADMHPRLDAGDLMLYYRLDTDVSAGDVIVFDKGGSQRVGRVVAKEGDTVSITDQEKLVINGSTVSETDIYYSTPRYEGFVEYPLTLGPGECFVLADNRHGGEDSRYFGPVSESEIEGTVITVIRRNNL